MIRALYSAVSGLTSDQTAMDVIGNDVANLDTVGFKTSTAEFTEELSQASQIADSATPVGIDVGLGTRIAATVTDFSQGSIQQTDVPSNVAISGNGYFIINSQATSAASDVYYSRNGDFTVDVSGNLRTTDGYYVQGYSVGTSGADDTSELTGFTTTVGADFSVSSASTGAIASTSLSNIVIPSSLTTTVSGVTTVQAVISYAIGASGAITVTGQDGTNVLIGYLPIALVTSQNGLNDVGGGYYAATEASGTPTIYEASTNQTGTLEGGALELSNADVATEFSNMIIIQNAYSANAKVITVSNEMLQTVDNMIQG